MAVLTDIAITSEDDQARMIGRAWREWVELRLFLQVHSSALRRAIIKNIVLGYLCSSFTESSNEQISAF